MQLEASIDFRFLFEFIPGLYMVFNTEYKVLEVCRMFSKHAGLEREEMIGKNILEVFSRMKPDSFMFEALKDSIDKVIITHKEVVLPTVTQTYSSGLSKEGSDQERYWRPISFPVLSDDGNLQFIILRMDDVTDLIKLEKQEKRNREINEQLRMEVQERRKIEEALHAAKQKFIFLLDALSVGVWLFDKDGKIDFVNKAAGNIWGEANISSIEEFKKFKGWRVDSGEPILPGEWPVVQVYEQGKLIANEEIRILGSDGTYRVLLNSSTLLFDANKKMTGVFMMNHDVTKQRKSEELLRESEKRLRSVFENSMDAVLLTSPDGKIVMANSKATEMFGFTEEELINLGRYAVTIPGDENLRSAIAERNKTGMFRGELTLKRKNGEHFPVELSSSLFKDQQGSKWSSMFIRDITKRKIIEKEKEALLKNLEEKKLWLEAVIERAPMGIFLVKGTLGNHITANRVAQKIFGSGVKWSQGLNAILGVVATKENKFFKREDLFSSRALNGETINGEEALIRRHDGTILPVEISSAPIQDNKKNILGVVTIFQDISSKKELERLREEWAAVIAHDLRQPIAAIQIGSDMLKHYHGSYPETEQIASMINSTAKHLNRMTNDLLDVSNLVANKLKLVLVKTDLVGLLNTIIQKLQMIYPENKIVFNVHSKVEELMADPDRIEQIIGNLISNGCKYGDPGTNIIVDIEQNQDKINVSVSNQGPGFEPDEINKLFQRFSRTKQGMKKGSKSLGLGLYITKGLVEAHGGTIDVRSEPGKTTSFIIQFSLK